MLDKKYEVKVGGDFSPLDMGVYQVQIVDVSAVEQANPFKGGAIETKFNYQMAVLDNNTMADGSTSRNRYLWCRCSPVLSEKSWLFKMAVAVLGRTLTKAEQESFDPESLVNKQVKVMVEQKPSKDGTKVFNNILSFSHADKEMEKVEFEAKPAVVEKTSVGIAIDNQEIDPEAEIKKLEEEKAKK